MAVSRLDIARLGSGAALLVGLGFAATALAQHPLPQAARPLHERLALADLAVLATIGEVSAGRIQLAEVRPLHGASGGAVDGAIAVKRSPSAPPPLAEGDRALLLLRGARSPYVLVDEPRETIRLADASAEERWSEAIGALLAAMEAEPERVPILYHGWIETGPATLRDLALRGLMDRKSGLPRLPAETYLASAEAAADPDRAAEIRRASAALVTLDGPATHHLLERIPVEGAADARVTLSALQGGILHSDPALGAATLRALRHPDPEIRESGLTAAGFAVEVDPALELELVRISREDERDALRERAERMIQQRRQRSSR